MKRERFLTGLTAGILAFFTAWGGAGCLVTAFDLPMARSLLPLCALLAGLSALLAGLSALLLSLPHGGKALLCLGALMAGYLWREGSALGQLWKLARHLSIIYDRAYDCGVLILPESLEQVEGFDWPVWIYAGMIAAAVCLNVCRQKTVWLPVLATLTPLAACIVVTDTVPEEPWLLMVMSGLTLLLLTTSVRRENSGHGLRLTLTLAVPVTAALAVLFLAYPQESYVNKIDQYRENVVTLVQNFPHQVETGMNRLVANIQGKIPQQIDLATLGPRITVSYPLLELTPERSGPVYLRQQDFDRYDGRCWDATENRRETFCAASGETERLQVLNLNQQELRLLPYHPAQPQSLFGGHPEQGITERTYAMLRTHLPEDWRQSAYNSQPDQGQWASFCDLPEGTLQQAQKLLKNLYPSQASNTEKADSIAAFVISSAVYDLSPDIMPEGEADFALWFLREAERGYCVHFATAAVVLLRAAEIPARYVTGYMVQGQAGKSVSVTEENAHAWAEYYEPALNLWLPLEATPGSEEETPEPRPIPTEASEPPETEVPEAPTTQQPPEEPEPQPSTQTAPPELSTQPPIEAEEEEPVSLLPLLVIPLLGLLLAAQRKIRLALRRRRQQTGSVNARALARWQESERLSRLLKKLPTEELMALAQKAKFSQHTLTEEELMAFDSFNRSCLRQLRKKPRYLRLIHQYIYAAY